MKKRLGLLMVVGMVALLMVSIYVLGFADMATKIETARGLIYSTSRMIDAGVKDITKAAAMSKLYASDIAMEVTIDAVQLMGGSGYMKEYPVEKMMRDAKITQIYEGTNQIMRQIIGLEILKKL